MRENPNRRGFVRATPNGHALQYADGTPFFLLGDTWLAASTWRLPWKGSPAAADYVPGPGISFEEAVAYRKRQGFNSISFIAAFPNWDADQRGATFANADGVYLRNAWEKFGHWAPDATVTTSDGATTTAKDMADEQGHRPFARLRRSATASPTSTASIPPTSAASTGRCGTCRSRASCRSSRRSAATTARPGRPTSTSTAPMPATCSTSSPRYGAYNLIFSGIHLDWIPKEYSLTADEFNAALTHHWKTYGALPFGQPYTTLIDSSTYRRFGHGERAPWLTMHTVGNKPRNNAIYALARGALPPEPALPGGQPRALLHGLEPRDQPPGRRDARPPTPTATTTSPGP